MKNQNHAESGGMGFLGVLEIIFIVLKLVGVIDWSWWLVLIPLWIELGILAIAGVILYVYYSKFD